MSKQLLRSATSVGAMVAEANSAESKKDFIHKLAIAQKELEESRYWITLLKNTGFLERFEVEEILTLGLSISRLLRKILMTAKTNLANRK